MLCFKPRWLDHGPNGFQLGLCVCIKSSSGKVAAKSNHLVGPSSRGGVRWWWTRRSMEKLDLRWWRRPWQNTTTLLINFSFSWSYCHSMMMFISPGLNMVNLKNKTSSLLINMLLSWLQVLLRHNLSAFGNLHLQFGLTSCFTGLICNIFNAPPFDLGPFRHKAWQKKPLGPSVTAAPYNSCNFIGLILPPCHKCSYTRANNSFTSGMTGEMATSSWISRLSTETSLQQIHFGTSM